MRIHALVNLIEKWNVFKELGEHFEKAGGKEMSIFDEIWTKNSILLLSIQKNLPWNISCE